MSRTEEAHALGVALAFEPGELLSPGDEVVHLLELDPPPVEAKLVGELPAPALGRASPDLRRDESLVAPMRESPPEHRLGAAVHRRGVEDAAASVEEDVDDGGRVLLALAPDVERAPRTEADDGKLEAGVAKASLLHGRIT